MQYYYSASTGGFYVSTIHSDIPEDAKEISEEKYSALLAGQNTGKIILADSEGFPVLVDAPAPSADVIQARRRQAYQLLADPLFFGWQRGDNTEAEWLAAVDKIKADYPYPTS